MSDVVHVIRAPVAPSAAPTREGQHWINTVTGDMWFSNGTATVANWVLMQADTDVKVKVSAADTTAGYLNDELLISIGANSTNALEKLITNPAADEKLTIRFDQSKINHDSLLNWVANKHIDHSTVSINSGTGLTGGGDITATRTLSLASISDNTILSNISGASAAPIPNTLTSLIDTISTTQGSILYRNATSWVALPPGTNGQVLHTQGTGANPIWAADDNSGGTVTSVALALPSFITVSGSPVTTSGTLTGTLASQSQNLVFASPNGSAGAPTFRALVAADIPALSYVTSVATGTGLTGGPITSSGTISLATIANNTILSNISGGVAAPIPNTLTALIDTVSTTQGSILYRNATSWVALPPGTSGQFLKTQGAAANPIWAADNNSGGTVTSVAMTVPSILSVAGSPITTSGTLALSLATQTANTIFAGPTTGAAAAPTFRTQVLADLPQLTNGQLYIGSTGASVVAATLTSGSGINITNAAGSITVAATVNSITTTRFNFQAAELDTPNNANWAINALAPLSSDTVNNALSVRRFDDTLEEGTGFTVFVPTGATNVIFSWKARAQTAPGTSQTVVMRLYNRQIPNNAAVTAWSAALALTTLTVPTNTNFQYYTQTISTATLGITAGRLVQFELTRHGANASDTLVGDFNLLFLTVEFS